MPLREARHHAQVGGQDQTRARKVDAGGRAQIRRQVRVNTIFYYLLYFMPRLFLTKLKFLKNFIFPG